MRKSKATEYLLKDRRRHRWREVAGVTTAAVVFVAACAFILSVTTLKIPPAGGSETFALGGGLVLLAALGCASRRIRGRRGET